MTLGLPYNTFYQSVSCALTKSHYFWKPVTKQIINFLSYFPAPNDTEKQYFDDHTSNNHLSNPSSDSKNSSSPIITSQKKSSPINIHIEVDIDPPKAVTAEDQLSPVELESLGLPSTHVHYSNTGNKPPSEELLAPSDIKV